MTTTLAKPAQSAGSSAEHLPHLETGDHLSRAEFERRYAAMPALPKAELIEGVVYVPSPVRLTAHGRPHLMLAGWLAAYLAATPGVEAADNATVRLDLENEPQPDLLLMIQPEAGGQSRVDEDGYLVGAPELVVEVAASSASIDRHTKLRVYRRNGVQEYLIWQVLDRHLEWFRLTDGGYAALAPDERGVISSQVFPGLRLHVPALLDGNLAAVLAELQAGIDRAEHAAFIERLTSHRRP